MVMDVTPSPQCVGREFVRQYYTLLNEAPQFLHRFYSNNSSFIHGGEAKQDDEEQKPVIGQNDIHKKIMSLNFKDCHAKIRYVDSQSTMATGVVVQVTGELSNNQEPLRRFMQTFVLAPQSPNKYYVHNDIFRYQDEVFADSDEEDELAEEEPAVDHQVSGKQSPPAEQVSQPDVHLYHQQMMAERDMHHQQVNGRVGVAVAEPVMPNGHVQESVSPPPPAVVQPEEPVQRLSTPEPTVTPATSEPEVSPEPVIGRVEGHPPPQSAASEDVEPTTSELPKPRSWANIAHVSGGPVAPTPATHQPTAFPQSVEQPAVSMDKSVPATQRVNPMRNNRPGATLAADQMAFGDSASVNKRSEDRPPVGDERRSDKVKYPDSQQIFVGNLPNLISEFELRDFFRGYGPVLEVRINRNSPNKLHFGFVVFESEATAQHVLGFKSLDYKGHRVNIEEKKARNDRPHSNSRHGGRRDGQRHMRGSGGGRGGGGAYSGPPREDGDSRADQGRFNNLNKSNQHRR